jgi:hypothetical protein
LSDFYFRNGYFERLNNEIEKLREESFGHLFKVSDKYDHKIYLQLKNFFRRIQKINIEENSNLPYC